MRRLRRKTAVLLATLAVLFLQAAPAEQAALLPPSPEPPAERVERPTPMPTPVPDITIVDHVHNPDVYPGFRFTKDAKLLEIWIPNIRDGDWALLTFDGRVYMIDCGDDRMGAVGAKLLNQLGITRIDTLFCSHLHHDHINGLEATDNAAKVSAIRVCFPLESTESGMRLGKVASARGIPVMEFRHLDAYSMGENAEVTLTFMKNSDNSLDMNNQSALTLVRYGERTILFTADMEKAGQTAMVSLVMPELLRCDILKYPHHAKNSLIDEFREATGAKLAVVTSQEGREDLGQKYLKRTGLPAIYTYVQGKYTHLVTDGTYWLCEYVDAAE